MSLTVLPEWETVPTMRKQILVVVALFAFACGKQGGERKVDCATSVNNAVNLSAEEFKQSGVPDASIAKIREVSTARCTEDKWTDEVKKCLADAKQADDVAKCQATMSKDQNEKLAKAILAVVPPPSADQGSAEGSSTEAGSGATAPVAGLPAECNAYQAMIEKLAACDKLPAASRDMLKKTFDESSQTWANYDKLPDDAKAALTSGCKQGADALKQAAGATCGF